MVYYMVAQLVSSASNSVKQMELLGCSSCQPHPSRLRDGFKSGEHHDGPLGSTEPLARAATVEVTELQKINHLGGGCCGW